MASEHSGHRERVKRRFLNEGLDSFEPYQVLEMLLFYSIPYRDTNLLAHRLIDRFGSLSAVIDADEDALLAEDGITQNTVVLLKLLPAVYKAYSLDKWNRPKVRLSGTDACAAYLRDYYAGATREGFTVLCLDAKNCLIKALAMDEGTVNEASISARKFVEAVIQTKATGIVMAHVHPSGNPAPSLQDIRATRQVRELLAPLGIGVYDHIILAGDSAASLAAMGVLEEQE